MSALACDVVRVPGDRPILFSGPMVRAILDGRKTQTRRIVRAGVLDEAWPNVAPLAIAYVASRCPYGVPGDRLWVRETWGDADRFYQSHENDTPGVVAYAADRSATQFNASRPWPIPPWDIAQWNWDHMKWRPSIYMPRWASRIMLEVTSVRVERLQDLTEEDAEAEGVEPDFGNAYTCAERDYRRAFERLWDSINAKRAPWESNPFVWVVSFRRLKSAKGSE